MIHKCFICGEVVCDPKSFSVKIKNYIELRHCNNNAFIDGPYVCEECFVRDAGQEYVNHVIPPARPNINPNHPLAKDLVGGWYFGPNEMYKVDKK